MKSSQILSLTLAGLLSTQQLAWAQTDRTTGIGDKQIADAQLTLKEVKSTLIALDQNLEQAEKQIKNQSRSSHLSSGVAIAGAAAGLGLMALSAASLSNRNQLGTYLSAALALVATGSSAVVGILSAGSKNSAQAQAQVQTEKAEAQLRQAQEEISKAAQESKDPRVITELKKLNNLMSEMQSSLSQYQDREDLLTKGKILSLVAQGAGVALTVYGITAEKPVLYGVALFTAGNIGHLLITLTPSQEKQVITEINKTRSLLAATMLGL